MNKPTHARPALSTLGVLAALYLAQGLPYGFFTQALPVMMRERGYALGEIGLASLLALPWALKFAWAPLVDRYGSASFGRRKSWILPLQLTTTAVVLIAGVLDPANLNPVLVAVFVINLLAATQDIATDALAVEMLPPSHRGVANGIQVAGYRVGMVIGGGALLIAFSTLGWSPTFGLMAGVVALTTIPIALLRERPRTFIARGDLAPGNAVSDSALRHFVRTPEAPLILLLLAVYKTGDALASAMVRPLLVDLGLSMAEIGTLLGIVGFVAGMIGALAGGLAVTVVGRRRALVYFGVVQTLAISLYVLVALGWTGLPFLYVSAAVEHFAGGLATAALFTCMMDWSRPTAAATDYTVQASAVVIATGTAAALGGFVAQAVGYEAHFALSACLSAGGVALAALLTEGEGMAIRVRLPGARVRS